MTDDWNDYADGWDDNSDVRRYANRAFASLDDHLNLRGKDWRSKRVLDFGCGFGFDADHFGLAEVKKRILEHLAVRQATGNQRGAILCMVCFQALRK